MREAYLASLRLQMTLVEAAAATSKVMCDNYLRFLDQQNALMKRISEYQRADDAGPSGENPKARKRQRRASKKKAASPCTGADLRDHYGKRARDVDVERI
ncbi:MAG: hypothetical protein OXR84_12435 [Magnetovibrio sp.]|nr:hypothetical protein [Magnetovibrio sp.]